MTSNDLRIWPLERSHSLWIRYKNELSLNWTKIHDVFKLCLLSKLLKRYRFSHFYCRKYINESLKISIRSRESVSNTKGALGLLKMTSKEAFSRDLHFMNLKLAGLSQKMIIWKRFFSQKWKSGHVERPMYSVPIEYICPRRTPSGENINERKGNKAPLGRGGAYIFYWDCLLVKSYLWTHSKYRLSYFIEFDDFHVHIDSWCIWLKYHFRHFYRTGHFLMRSCDVLELVFDELFCSNVDNNCVLTFDWFLSESTIWLDANEGTNFSVGGQLLDA